MNRTVSRRSEPSLRTALMNEEKTSYFSSEYSTYTL